MQQDCNFFALSVIDNSPSVNLIVIKTAINCHNHKKVKFPLLLCLCRVSPSLFLDNAIPSNMEYFINFHCSRLEHPSQGGNFFALLLRHHGKQLDSWVVATTFLILIPPIDFGQFNHTRSSLRHHRSIYEVQFGPNATNICEMSRCRLQSQVLDMVAMAD
jgi:hypothetical protein